MTKTNPNIPLDLLYHLANLKHLGWTKAAIDKFLPSHDATKRNPMFAKAAPMKLYLRERVHAIMETQEWLDWQKASTIRKAASNKVVDAKKQKLLSVIDKWEPVIAHVPNVVQKAIDSYNERSTDRGEYNYASKNESPEFLDRITHNYIRHQLTDYEGLLASLYGKVGKQEAYEMVKDKVMQKIDELYYSEFAVLNARRKDTK